VKEIYLDYAATTPMDKEVLLEMLPYYSEIYGNPGSFHYKGLEASDAIEQAREKVAKIFNCNSKEIVFTSGGTESINFALKGIAFANKEKGNHIITSAIEHHAVLHTCDFLRSQGFEVTFLPVDKYGFVSPDALRESIKPETILVSIMYANNEIGTIQNISELASIAKEKSLPFHTDACQAAGFLDLDVEKLGVDLLSLNGSKIYGPKGTGLLYIRSGIEIEPLIHGGGQENGFRSGTENVPGIIGFAKALELAQRNKEYESARLIQLRDALISGLLKLPKARLNGPMNKRLPNNVNISFLDIEGESLILMLNEQGVFASTGSACASKNLETSHVLRAIGLPYEASHGSLRFTLGKNTTMDDLNYVLRVLPDIVAQIKKLSPLNLDMEHFK
jgi:cysteine desulfurase